MLSPSLGARETPPHTPANLRMSSIYTWLWECVTHGSSVPHSWCVHLRVRHLTKGEGNCTQLSPWSQKPKVTQSRLRTQHTEARHTARVLGDGSGSVYRKTRGFSVVWQESFLPCRALPQATVLHQARWPRPQRLPSNVPAPTETLCWGKKKTQTAIFHERTC